MNLSSPFIRRPVMTTFVMLSIVLVGLMAFFKLPVSDLPTIERPHIVVSAGLSGANSDTILNQVTTPLEKELMHVKGVQEISSVSSQGLSQITLSFDVGKSMNDAANEVQKALNRAESSLPSDLSPRPSYQMQEDSQEPIMYLVVTSEHTSGGDLRAYADAYIIPRLTRIDGVAQAMAFGSGRSVTLKINPELMAARNIGFNQVIDTVKQQTAEAPLGSIESGNKKFSVELTGTIQHGKDLENVRIGTTAVRIRDIGEITVKDGNDQPFRFVTNDKSSPALILAIQKVADANTVAISKRVQRVLGELQKELPPSIHVNLWFDKAVWIKESIFDVQLSLIFAFVLVIAVIYFSLGRLSESLIVSAALPLSLVGTFAVMYLLGFSLDLLSLLALTLAVGFVVDDAIVVLENIIRCQDKEELAPREASLIGSKQIGFTILSMTLSLVAVFIPLLFMPGMNGKLFREFSITLAVAILVSGFISLTLTPMLCSRFLAWNKGKKTSLQESISRSNHWMVELYGRTLQRCFAYPKTIALGALASLALSVFLFGKLPVNLVPPEDRGYVFGMVVLPEGISTSETKKHQKKLEALVQGTGYVENFLDISWEGNLLFVMRLKSKAERPAQSEVVANLQKAIDVIPGSQTFLQGYQMINLDLDFGHAGQYQLVVRGSDSQDVMAAAGVLARAMQDDSHFVYAQTTASHDSPVLAFRIDEDQAHKLGFNKQQIQTLLKHAYGKNSLGTIRRGAVQEKISMELLSQYNDSTNAPSKLYLAGTGGALVPLRALVNWEQKLAMPSFERSDQLAAASIRFSLASGMAPSEGLQYAQELAAKVLPANVGAILTGSAKTVVETSSETLVLLLAATVVMYIVLGILYESFVHPLTILSSLPLAGLGGVLTLFLFDEPISIFSAVGFLLLIGLVKKNGIMMVDYAVEAQRQGLSPQQAIYQACLIRFRPIMMTTVAAIAGALPIAIGLGDGSEMRRGLGIVIVGGLLFSQLLTLYVTPILFVTFNRYLTGKAE